MGKITWERAAAILLCLTLGVAVLYGAWHFLFPVLFPFLLGWLLSLPLRPLSAKLARGCRLPQKVTAAVLIVLAVCLGAWGLWSAGVLLWREAVALTEQLIADGQLARAFESAQAWIAQVGAKFGLSDVGERASEWLTEAITGVLGTISAGLPNVLSWMLGALPSFFFVLVLTVVSGYYFCIDGAQIRAFAERFLTQAQQDRIARWRVRGRAVFGKYCRAYLQLLALTFTLLFVGLLILRVEYAFLPALLIALLDLLPVIGVGTVMVPWSLLLLIQRNFYLGFGILILYLIIELVRQIAEPKILGRSLGLHPLATLFATYAGFYFFGLLGMIIAPFAALGVKTIFGGEKTT